LFSLRDAYNELSLHFLAKKGFLVSTDIERPTLTLSAGLWDGNLSLTPIICSGKFGTHRLGRERLDRRRYQLNKFVKITGVGSLGKKDRRRYRLNKVVKLAGVGNLGKTLSCLKRDTQLLWQIFDITVRSSLQQLRA
jgi:hypothetical protein